MEQVAELGRTGEEGIMRLISFVTLVVALVALATPAAARASDSGGWFGPCGTCGGSIDGLHTAGNMRGVRVDLQRSFNSWDFGSETNVITIGIEIYDLSGDEIKVGFAKTTGTSQLCTGSGQTPVSTGGVVKLWWNATGTSVCGVGSSAVGQDEDHIIKVQRCNSSDWCIYVDSTQKGSDVTGYPAALPFVKARGISSATTIHESALAYYNDTGTDWQITDTGVSGCNSTCWDWDVRGADTDPLSGNVNWNIDPISVSAPWGEGYNVSP